MKTRQAELCQNCRTDLLLNDALRRPLSDFILKSNPYSKIRIYARKIMTKYGPEKRCKVCNFDVVVEVAHILAIPSFNLNTPRGIVNALDNMVYLCPNHHAMFERNLIEI